MPKPNYEFAKRQRDLIKKQKKEQKQQRKAGAQQEPTPEDPLKPPVDKPTQA